LTPSGSRVAIQSSVRFSAAASKLVWARAAVLNPVVVVVGIMNYL
jgi:hypothetical protein